ncbi:MAG TPA: alpha/beta hydrolase-fold protein [Allosphingosinicella sp.]|nr:alpha/beta hydrolase-fold protein [Allosphingosinicella sp.]
MRLVAAAAMLLAAAPAGAETLALERADGSAIIYHLDRPREGRRPMLLLLQGSGCDRAGGDAQLAATAPVLAPGHAVLRIEKYGVGTEGSAAVEGCPAAYWSGNTLTQRVLDAVQVIARLRRERWWNRELFVFGGSEGGAVAAMLAPLVPETRAVVIRSSGIGVPVAELIRAAVPPPVAAELPRILAEARANPSGAIRWGGASYRWWADAAELVPARMLLQTDAPVLLIHGARDQFAPVSSARAARDLFAAAGARNLTYREYPLFDHFMTDAGGVSHREAVLREAASWLRRNSR